MSALSNYHKRLLNNAMGGKHSMAGQTYAPTRYDPITGRPIAFEPDFPAPM